MNTCTTLPEHYEELLSIDLQRDKKLALVVHGGTIMTLLEALEPGGQFYRWQAPNGGGFRCSWDGGVLTAEAALSAGGETPVL